jgi:hypothetical protein
VAKAKLEVRARMMRLGAAAALLLADATLARLTCYQIGFLDFVVRPLYTLLQSPGLAPGLGTRCLALIQANRTSWNSMISDAVAARTVQPRHRA